MSICNCELTGPQKAQVARGSRVAGNVRALSHKVFEIFIYFGALTGVPLFSKITVSFSPEGENRRPGAFGRTLTDNEGL